MNVPQLARKLIHESPLKATPRPDLLGMIRKANGGLPFAIALGDEDDDDTVWVALDNATDDELRLYLAFNELQAQALLAVKVRSLVDEAIAQRVQEGRLEVGGVDAEGNTWY